MAADPTDHTFATRFRIPRRMWDAYGTAASRQGIDRSADLVDHVRTFIKEHGNEHELAELAAAEDELAERRARKGGRPRKGETASAVRQDPGAENSEEKNA
jgi:hypothetical protein